MSCERAALGRRWMQPSCCHAAAAEQCLQEGVERHTWAGLDRPGSTWRRRRCWSNLAAGGQMRDCYRLPSLHRSHRRSVELVAAATSSQLSSGGPYLDIRAQAVHLML